MGSAENHTWDIAHLRKHGASRAYWEKNSAAWATAGQKWYCHSWKVSGPRKFSDQYEINQQVVQVVGSVYGQIAQAQQESQVTQVQYNFQDLERLVEEHTEINASERQTLKDRVREIEQELRKDSFSQSKVRKWLESKKKYQWLFPLIVEAIERLLKSSLVSA